MSQLDHRSLTEGTVRAGQPGEIFETYVFVALRKEGLLNAMLDTMLSLAVQSIDIEYSDRPSQEFRHFNERAKKIISSLPAPHKVERIKGEFDQSGSFEMKGSALTISIPADNYNFEVVDSMRRFLSPTFPLCIFQNPYIWGVDLYADYDRDLFFGTRVFTSRSQLLEEPQIDIFRRDDGIIYKFRFHLKDELAHLGFDQGFKVLCPIFEELYECIKRGNYEGIEILNVYCTDRARFRHLNTRTKIGQKIKAILNER